MTDKDKLRLFTKIVLHTYLVLLFDISSFTAQLYCDHLAYPTFDSGQIARISHVRLKQNRSAILFAPVSASIPPLKIVGQAIAAILQRPAAPLANGMFVDAEFGSHRFARSNASSVNDVGRTTWIPQLVDESREHVRARHSDPR